MELVAPVPAIWWSNPQAGPKGQAISHLYGWTGKGGSAMTQVAQAQTAQAAQQQQTSIPLREMSIPEVVAAAISRRRMMLTKGKTSRRVVLHLKPHLIPPPSGSYQCAIGEVRIFSKFDQDRGAWLVEVKLPPDEGFRIADFVKGPSQ
jgi:hypothetical protein